MGQMASALEFTNNADPWKKIDTLSTKIAPAATKMVQFGPKKPYLSTGTKNAQNELCFGT